MRSHTAHTDKSRASGTIVPSRVRTTAPHLRVRSSLSCISQSHTRCVGWRQPQSPHCIPSSLPHAHLPPPQRSLDTHTRARGARGEAGRGWCPSGIPLPALSHAAANALASRTRGASRENLGRDARPRECRPAHAKAGPGPDVSSGCFIGRALTTGRPLAPFA